ncbi:hypothetical protein Tco_0368286 [Tanacetum coccineum]
MVAFLEKPTESDGFHETIDFLNANQIHYALTVNPTIYTSCIEQFWATAKANTGNGKRQLQALVDKKRVIIIESRIRSDFHLADAGGIDCLLTATIFEELARMGYEKPSQRLTFYKAFFSPQGKFLIYTITQCLSSKSTAWNEFSKKIVSAIICLATNQKCNLSKYIFDAMVKHLEGGVKFLMYPCFVQVFLNNQLGDMSHHKTIYVNPSHTKKIFANMKREGKDFSGHLLLLNHHPLDLRRSSLGGNRGRKLKFLKMRHIMMIVFLYLLMIHFSVVTLVIVKDDDIAIYAIPLATEPPVIVEYKLIKEGIIGHYQLIRADGSSKRYSSMIRML